MDKLLHFIFSFFGVIILYTLLGNVVAASFWMLFIGFIKEIFHDFLLGRGVCEFKDMLFNFLGVTLAFILFV